MGLPIGVGAVNTLYALVSLYFTEKRLDLLEKMTDYMYEIAEREVALAETLFELHKQLRARDPEYFRIANSAPIYGQKYNCALATANTDIIRDIGREMYRRLSATDMYSAGLRRDIIETSMGAVVDQSSGQFTMAYKNEDSFHYDTYINKYQHIAASVREASLNVNTDALSRVERTVSDIAVTAADSASVHLGRSVESITTAVRDVTNRQSSRDARISRSTPVSVFDQDGPGTTTGAGQIVPPPSTTSGIIRNTQTTSRSNNFSNLNSQNLNSES